MSVLPEPDPLPAASPRRAEGGSAPEPTRGLAAASAVSLGELEPGTSAVIQASEATTPVGRRLLDLGFVPGTEVTVVRRAPLGDPIEYALRGYRLCLRRRDAARVLVLPRASSPPGDPARSG